MAATQVIDAKRSMIADYDSAADVLYVMINAPEPVEGDGGADGVELDYSLKDGSPCGVTVIGYKHYGWPNKIERLAEIVGEHLTLRPGLVSSTIDQLMSNNIH